MKNHKSQGKIKAKPYFEVVAQFAFLHGLPFFFYTDQKRVFSYYEESLKNAGGKQ